MMQFITCCRFCLYILLWKQRSSSSKPFNQIFCILCCISCVLKKAEAISKVAGQWYMVVLSDQSANYLKTFNDRFQKD